MNDFFKWRRLRKEVKDTVKSAKSLVNMRRDLMDQQSVDEIETAGLSNGFTIIVIPDDVAEVG